MDQVGKTLCLSDFVQFDMRQVLSTIFVNVLISLAIYRHSDMQLVVYRFAVDHNY